MPAIDKILRESITKSTLILNPIARSSERMLFEHLSPARFPNLKEYRVDLGFWCNFELEKKERYPIYHQIRKLRFQTHGDGKIDDTFVHALFLSPQLKVLKLSHCYKVSNPALANMLKNMPALEILGLGGIDLKSSSELTGFNLPNLEKFEIKNGRCLSDQFLIEIIKAAIKLNKIKIKGYDKMTEEVFACLEDKNLSQCSLKSTEGDAIGDTENGVLDSPFSLKLISKLIKSNKNLRKLSLRIDTSDWTMDMRDLDVDLHPDYLQTLKLTHFVMPDIYWLINKANQIEELTLKCCFDFRINQIPLTIALPNLKNLTVTGCEEVSDDYIQRLALSSSQLANICVDGCYEISGKFMKQVKVDQLKNLSLTVSIEMKSHELGDLMRRAPLLEHIAIRGEIDFEESGFGDLRGKLQNLKSFYLSKIINSSGSREPKIITADVAHQILQTCPMLKTAHCEDNFGISKVEVTYPRSDFRKFTHEYCSRK